jgi:hypothetical protein
MPVDPNASVRISAFNWVPPVCPAATARRCYLPIQLPGARATAWLIAALNSVEPYLMQLATIDIFATGEEWARLRRPGVIEMIDKRLSRLSDALGDKAYLDGDRFTAGDLIMTTVTRQSIRDLLTEAVPEYAIVAVSTCEELLEIDARQFGRQTIIVVYIRNVGLTSPSIGSAGPITWRPAGLTSRGNAGVTTPRSRRPRASHESFGAKFCGA